MATHNMHVSIETETQTLVTPGTDFGPRPMSVEAYAHPFVLAKCPGYKTWGGVGSDAVYEPATFYLFHLGGRAPDHDDGRFEAHVEWEGPVGRGRAGRDEAFAIAKNHVSKRAKCRLVEYYEKEAARQAEEAALKSAPKFEVPVPAMRIWTDQNGYPTRCAFWKYWNAQGVGLYIIAAANFRPAGVAFDWAAYIGACTAGAEDEAAGVDLVLREGGKLSRDEATALFPDFAEHFAYRD